MSFHDLHFEPFVQQIAQVCSWNDPRRLGGQYDQALEINAHFFRQLCYSWAVYRNQKKGAPS